MDILEKHSTKPTSKTLVTITRRTTIIIAAIAVVAVVVSGAILSNYIVPSTVNITSQPGIVVLTTDTVPSCTTTPVTSFAIGDVQQGQSKAFAVICIKNSQGSANQFILPQSLTTQAALPSGVTLTWNFPTSPVGTLCGTVTTGCIGLGPGQQTPPLTLTLSASTTATAGALSFTIVFNAYSTATG